MPYLIISDRNGELDRRDLREPLIIGRALDCDVCIRDILLSRKHCRIEPFQKRWVVTDLGSKNGTRVEREKITRHVLSDGEVIRIGRSQVCFRSGKFEPATWKVPRRSARPANPQEAMAGTVFGFQLFDMEEDSRVSGFPIPKPRPAEPASYRRGEAGSLVSEIASTKWDEMLSEPPWREPAPKRPAQPQRPPTPVQTDTAPSQVIASIAVTCVVAFASLMAVLWYLQK